MVQQTVSTVSKEGSFEASFSTLSQSQVCDQPPNFEPGEVVKIASSIPIVTAAEREEDRAMRSLLRRIGRRSLFTGETRRQLGDPHLASDVVHALITLLEGPFEERWEERMIAVWALGRVEGAPQHRAAIARSLCAVVDTDHRRASASTDQQLHQAMRRSLPFSGVVGLIAAGATITLLAATAPQDVPLIHDLWWAVFAFVGGLGAGLSSGYTASVLSLPFTLPASVALDTVRFNRVRVAATTALGRLHVPQSVGVLAKAVSDSSPNVRRAAVPALQSAISTLTPAHYGTLGGEVVPHLCAALERARERLSNDTRAAEALALSALTALENVGDGRAVTPVRRMVNTGWTAPVNALATRLLPILQERQRQEDAREMLLRGAMTPPPSSELLLRPAVTPPADPPELLLRPQ